MLRFYSPATSTRLSSSSSQSRFYKPDAHLLFLLFLHQVQPCVPGEASPVLWVKGAVCLSPWPFSLVVLPISNYLVFNLSILQLGIRSQD